MNALRQKRLHASPGISGAAPFSRCADAIPGQSRLRRSSAALKAPTMTACGTFHCAHTSRLDFDGSGNALKQNHFTADIKFANPANLTGVVAVPNSGAGLVAFTDTTGVLHTSRAGKYSTIPHECFQRSAITVFDSCAPPKPALDALPSRCVSM